MDDARELLKLGVAQARKGERVRARTTLARAVQIDPTLVEGWWALAHLVEDPSQRVFCLEQVLKLDPGHTQAQASLTALRAAGEPGELPRKDPALEVGEGPVQLSQPGPMSQASEMMPPDVVPGRGRPIIRSWLTGLGLVAALATILLVVNWRGLQNLIMPAAVTTPLEPSNLVVPTLPPRWTATPTFTPGPTPTLPAAVPPTQHPTTRPEPTEPIPEAIEDSNWAIRIEGPAGWSGARELLELSDGSVLAMGPVYESSLKTIWLARVERSGNVAWMRAISLPGDQTFNSYSLGAGPEGSGLVSGKLRIPTGGRVDSSSLLFSISDEGEMTWRIPYLSASTNLDAEGTLLISEGLNLTELASTGDFQRRAALDFGTQFLVPPDFVPWPRLLQAQRLADGSYLASGLVEDNLIPGDGVAMAGPLPGYTAYWFARFSTDGSLGWKHYFVLNGLEQGQPLSAVIEGGRIAVGGTKRQRVDAEGGYYYRPLYAWVRVLDENGRTVFHRRYLDLGQLEGIRSSPDGGLLLLGKVFTEVHGDPFGQEQAKLVRVDREGNIVWARAFPVDLRVQSALPLEDGTTLVAYGRDIAFARLDVQGYLPDCGDISTTNTGMRVDNEPGNLDLAAQVPLSMSIESGEPDHGVVRALGLSRASYKLIEVCRVVP